MINVKMDRAGFYKLRSDPRVVAELERRGRQVLNAANSQMPNNRGFMMSSFQGRKVKQGRWFVQVYAVSNHAKYANAKHNILIRALNETQSPRPAAVDLRPGEHP